MARLDAAAKAAIRAAKIKDAIGRTLPNTPRDTWKFDTPQLKKDGKYSHIYAEKLKKINDHGLRRKDKPICVECGDDADPQCIYGSYEEVFEKCEGEAHHIVPDGVYRDYARGDDTEYSFTNAEGELQKRKLRSPLNQRRRVVDAPTLNKGQAICISKADHDKVHALIEDKIKQKKDEFPGWGSGEAAKIGEIADICMDALEDVTEQNNGTPPTKDCAEKANGNVVAQIDGIEDEYAGINMTDSREHKSNLIKFVPLNTGG